MRFSSIQEVKDWASLAAMHCIRAHREHGHDLNPYSTQGARTRWQRGFDGDTPRPYEGTLDWDTQYQQGAATKRLLS